MMTSSVNSVSRTGQSPKYKGLNCRNSVSEDMHLLVAVHGQPGWVAALTPLSVDGMIVAASTTLLADSRSGSRGGSLPWLLLAAGSIASLSANVAVAEPTVTGRVIAASPSFALIGSYVIWSPRGGVRHVDHEGLRGRDLCCGRGYLPLSIMRISGGNHACSAGAVARLVA